MTEDTAARPELRTPRWGLSGKLLVLTILFVMIAEVLIYVPSMANFRLNWLKDRLASAHTAALVLDAVPPRGTVPESLTRKILDDVGIAERELAAMQGDLASMLQHKSRLAALGLAVSKINHDLRNLLASAQLFSDRLSQVPDPNVQRFAPKLMRSLERAIAFCQSTLSYGQAQEPPPDRRMVPLEPLVEEVRETLE